MPPEDKKGPKERACALQAADGVAILGAPLSCNAASQTRSVLKTASSTSTGTSGDSDKPLDPRNYKERKAVAAVSEALQP